MKEMNESFEKHILFGETHIWTACGEYVIFFDLLSKGGTDGWIAAIKRSERSDLSCGKVIKYGDLINLVMALMILA